MGGDAEVSLATRDSEALDFFAHCFWVSFSLADGDDDDDDDDDDNNR